MCARIIIILVFVLSFNHSYAQKLQSDISLLSNGFNIKLKFSEEDFSTLPVKRFTIVDYYGNSNENRAGQFKLPSKTFIIAIPPNEEPKLKINRVKRDIKENTVPAINSQVLLLNDSTIQYENRELKDVNSSSDLLTIEKYFWVKDLYCAVIKINTHDYNNSSSSIERITDIDFDIIFKSKIKQSSERNDKSDFDAFVTTKILNGQYADQFRTKRANINSDTYNWINFKANYIKISVVEDAIFRLYGRDIADVGYDLIGIDPNTFQIILKGVEIPISVISTSDNEFNEEDYIEFWGTKNYNDISPRIINEDDKPYNEFLNMYTDTNYYFLTWNHNVGKRIEEKDELVPTNDTLNYHYNFTHYEENPRDALFYTFHQSLVNSQLPFWDTGKAWYWNWLANWRSQLNVEFFTKNLSTEGNVYFYSKIMSFGSNIRENTHKYAIEFNGITLDTEIVNRYERTLLEGSVPSKNLVEGANNVLIKYWNNGEGAIGSSLLDWVEVEYPELLILDSNSLRINFLHEQNGNNKTVRIANTDPGNEYLIYRTEPTLKKIANQSREGTTLFFQDSISNGHKYFITELNSTKVPKLKGKIFNNLVENLIQVDYLAITHPDFLGAVNNYSNIISNGYGLTTEVVSVQDLYDQFGFGYPTPESIKEFIKLKIINSPSPQPSYFVIVGDANYDYKGYRYKYAGVIGGKNMIPTYGFPVSDTWYTIFDDSIIPEAFIGRIPANSIDEINYYSEKVKNYINSDFSAWNKRSIFFSGGDGNDPSQLQILKNANDKVINEIVAIPPLSSNYTHFYKSKEGDFGPFEAEEIKTVIDNGGLFISYIGHSGTATWDNSISDVLQLKNKFGRSPLISDFGCSTNKFAEPDIISFGERFLLDPDGDAIGYIGNSALGFTSIATSAPTAFYSSLLLDTNKSIGAIHYNSKINMLNTFGNTSIFNVYNYTSTLIGDPAVRIKIPEYPNLSVNQNNLIIENGSNISSQIDSIDVMITLPNEGLVVDGKIELLIEHHFNGKSLFSKTMRIPIPYSIDTVKVKLAVKGLSGVHTLKVNIDPDNLLREINEEDNSINYEFYVFSRQLKDLLIHANENPKLEKIKILSPYKADFESKLILEISDNVQLNNSIKTSYNIDSIYTLVNFSNEQWERTWFRYGIESADTLWSSLKSFSNKNASVFLLDDSVSFYKQEHNLLNVDSSLTIADKEISLGVVSAGSFAGANCIITKNGKNILENSFFAGIGIAVLDRSDFSVDTTQSFELWNNPENVRSFTKFLESINDQKLVLMGVSYDAINNINDSLKNAIKLFGSKLIDSLEFKGSWAFIGSKSFSDNEILEEVLPPYNGPASLVKEFRSFNLKGNFITNSIGPVKKWKTLNCTLSNIGNSSVKIIPIGIGSQGVTDTLDELSLVEGMVNLDQLNNYNYDAMKFKVNLVSSDDGKSPEIKSLEIDYESLQELAINYQVVSVENDTLQQGEDANLSFYVYNVGESAADSFKVIVEVVKPDNSKENILTEIVDSLGSEKRRKFNLSYPTTNFNGLRTFAISIDSDDKVLELYEDNNFYNIPFYVTGDTTKPSMNLTIDGNDIFDGEYIANKPEIIVELSDPSLIPITDTSSISIFLNNRYISYKGNEEMLSINYSASNPKAIVNYKPTLEDGEYTLRVFGKDASGNIGDSSGITKTFNVESNAKLLNVYNYPNPFVDDTYFTFKLTQIPDQIKIKVFTIAGRLIKEIVLNNGQLNFDLNKIHWDGRDEDGDQVGNGVYLYKVIMDVDGKKQDVTQKLAVVR